MTDGMTTTWYIAYDDGTIEMFETDQDGMEPVLIRPGHFITKDEYDQLAAEMQAASDAKAAEADAAAAAQRKADYDALRALGVPEDTARRLTGYTGP